MKKLKPVPPPPKWLKCRSQLCSGRTRFLFDLGALDDRPNRFVAYKCPVCKKTLLRVWRFATPELYDSWQYCETEGWYDHAGYYNLDHKGMVDMLREPWNHWNAGAEEYWACRYDCKPAPALRQVA